MLTRNHKFPLAPGAKDFRYSTIYPHDLPPVMRRHIVTGAMGTIYGTLTTGMFLIAWGDRIGVTIVQWGILGAISSFAISMQLVSAFGAARLGYRRLIWFVLEFINRSLRASALCLAFYFFHQGYEALAASLMILVFCIAAFFSAASIPPWYSWLADIIPEKIHGKFMGRRDAWISLATLIVVLPAGYGLDAVADEYKLSVLEIIFAVGILLGMVDLFLHRIIPEPAPQRETQGRFLQQVLAPLRDPEYRPWLVFTTCWSFAVFLGGALATVFFVNDLGIKHNFLGGAVVLIVVPLVGTLLTARWSGILIDRLGVKRMLIGSHFCWAILPMFWVVAVPKTALLWLAISSFIGGSSVSAAVNSSNKFMTRVPPPSQRAMYIAVTACINNIAGGIATLFAGYFLQGLEGFHWSLGGKELIPFHILFIVSFALRLASWVLLFRIKTPKFDTGKV